MLCISRTRGTVSAAARIRSRRAASSGRRLDVDDDVALGQSALHGGLDGVRGGMTLPDARIRRDADDDVREVAPRGLPHAQAPELHLRLQPLDRRARSLLGVGRHAIHEHVDVAAHEPVGRGQDERRDEERRDRVSLQPAGAGEQEPDQNGSRPDEVAGEVERVRGERGAAVAARGAKRHRRPARVHGDHDQDDDERVPDGVHVRLGRADEDRERPVRDVQAREHEDPRLRERREMLRLPVSVRVPAVGRAPGDADCEQRQQRRHEVGPGVHSLRDEAQAPTREPGAELQRDEHARGDDRDKCRAPLRAHPAKAKA